MEMTLEERVLRLEAHLGIGDSHGAIETRQKTRDREIESRRSTARLRYLVNIFHPEAGKRFKEELEAINSSAANDLDGEACSPSSAQIGA